MKVTTENIKDITYIFGSKDIIQSKNILTALLKDVDSINILLETKYKENKKIYIDYINEHTEYSPERTEPCPDYYGMFYIRFENKTHKNIGGEMTLEELDNALYIITNFIDDI